MRSLRDVVGGQRRDPVRVVPPRPAQLRTRVSGYDEAERAELRQIYFYGRRLARRLVRQRF